jgi:hypothetical protein
VTPAVILILGVTVLTLECVNPRLDKVKTGLNYYEKSSTTQQHYVLLPAADKLTKSSAAISNIIHQQQAARIARTSSCAARPFI